MWRQHLPSLLLLFIALCAGGVFAFSLGQAKPFAAIAWYDVLGETVTLLVACGWLGLVVAYRPTGWVSRCLIAGTGLLIWSYALDLFDEFLKYSGVDLHWRIEPMFGAPVSRVCIPRALLFQPFADADPARFATLQGRLRARSENDGGRVGVLEFLRRRVRRALPRTFGLEQAAAVLSMSGSSLKRLLAQHGLSYGELIDEVRAELAWTLLREQRWSNPRVAERLGYANEHNFRRAFKRWTGRPPQRRARALAIAVRAPAGFGAPDARITGSLAQRGRRADSA